MIYLPFKTNKGKPMSRMPYYLYLVYHFLYMKKIPLFPTLLMYINRILWGAYIPPSCKLGKGLKFGYGGSAVVIHAKAIVGSNCIINPAVTIGGRSKQVEVPIIGDNVYIGGGAKVLGSLKIGNNVVIGANAVVITNVPSNSVVAGIPAKIIKENIKMEDYV